MTRAATEAIRVLLARHVPSGSRDRVAVARREARRPVTHCGQLMVGAARDGVALQQTFGVVVEAMEGVGGEALGDLRTRASQRTMRACYVDSCVPPRSFPHEWLHATPWRVDLRTRTRYRGVRACEFFVLHLDPRLPSQR